MHSQASSSTQRRPALTQCEDATSNLEPYVFLAKHPRRCSGPYFQGIGISLTLATACCFAVAQQQSGPQGGLRCLKVSDACTYRPGYHYTSAPTVTGRRLFFSLSVSWCVFRNRQALSMVEHDVRGHSRCEPSTISCPQEAVASSRDQPRQLARARGVYVALEQRRTRDNVVFAIGVRKIARS